MDMDTYGNRSVIVQIKELRETKQDIIQPDNKLSSDLIDDVGMTHRFVTETEKGKIASLQRVAFTGSYDDLTDTPVIPSIPDITVTGGTQEAGKAIVALTASGHALTASKATFLTEHQSLSAYSTTEQMNEAIELAIFGAMEDDY